MYTRKCILHLFNLSLTSKLHINVHTGERFAFQVCQSIMTHQKTNFLRKISSDNYSKTVSSQTLASLSDDIVCLIHECQDLKQYFHSKFTSAILQLDVDTHPFPQEIKEDILSRYHDLRLAQYEGRADMSIIVEVERIVGWSGLWDLLHWTMAQVY